jgi:hypothetical protein
MSLDARARQASTSLLALSRKDVEVYAMLQELQHTEVSHQSRRRRTAAVLVVAVVVGLMVFGAMSLSPSRSSAPPAGNSDGPSVSQTANAVEPAQTFYLPATVSAVVPASWDTRSYSGGVDFQSKDGPGISLVMDPTPFGTGKPKTLTAETFARWIESRPYLQPTQAVPITVSGQPAWQVDVRLRDSAAAKSLCQPDITECIQMVKMPFTDLPTGIAHAQVGRMIFVQYPGRILWLYEWDGGGSTADNLRGVLSVLKPVFDSINLGPLHS